MNPNPSPNNPRRFALFILFLLLIILVIAGIIWFQHYQEVANNPPEPPQIPPPTSQYPPPVPIDLRGPFYYGGMPKSIHPVTVLTNIGFVVGYDEENKCPDWVCYRLFQVNSLQAPPRPKSFSVDYRTRARVSSSEYTGSGYDRGHMAPNFAIAVCYGSAAQLQTFLMSNIIPQSPKLNREVWENLERLEIRDYAQKFKEIWVVTGPVYGDYYKKLKDGRRIPSSSFKILVDEVDGKPRMLAFQMWQDVTGTEPLNTFLTRVLDIQMETGLDFFSDLEDGLEMKLESEKPSGMW